MVTIKNILTLIFPVFPFLAYGQADTSVKTYEYTICIYEATNENSTVLKNEKIGTADTITSVISGTIVDYRGDPIGFALLSLINLTDSSEHLAEADSVGNFRLLVPSDKYKLTAMFVSYTDLTIDELQLGVGEHREMELQLGKSSGFNTYIIRSEKPLSKWKLKRMKRKMKRGD